jgi:hypothetical protein
MLGKFGNVTVSFEGMQMWESSLTGNILREFHCVLKSEMITEILKALSLETISICLIEQWVHIYTDRSTDPHKGSAGAGFSCTGYFEGKEELLTPNLSCDGTLCISVRFSADSCLLF